MHQPINLWLIHYQSLKFRSLPMHILLEEAPLLVYYFFTLFLSNYKLQLILSIFWTTSTFCQLELPCSLCSLRSLGRSLAHFVHCARTLRSLRSLLALAYARADSSLRSLYNKRSLCSHLLHSLVPSISIVTSSLHLTSLVTTLRRVPPV